MSNNRSVASVINPHYVPAGNGSLGTQQFLGGTTSRKLAKRAAADGKSARGRDDPDIAGAINDLLGDTVITPVMSRNLDLVEGYPHSTTGIPYAIQGTAKVIQVGVGEYLTSFSDPIKTILGTSIHREAKVIITRKYVVGGRSLITPEHAPARTVAIQEDAREVMMTRYGGDIEMNLNLFLRPEDAKEELDLKISAQRRELERTLVEHGYNVLMEEGTDIVDAIIRSNPSYSTETGAKRKDIQAAAERINMSTVFGAMSKHRFPVQNLMAAAKYASAYTTTNQKGSVLLLPHASTDLLRSTRRENMVYSISGPDLLQRNKGKPIDMQFEDSYVDPATNVRIVIHRPFPTFQSGVANPDVGPGPLTDTVSFASYYTLPGDNTTETRIVDFHNRCWHNIGARDAILAECGGPAAAPSDEPGWVEAVFTDFKAMDGADKLVKAADDAGKEFSDALDEVVVVGASAAEFADKYDALLEKHTKLSVWNFLQADFEKKEIAGVTFIAWRGGIASLGLPDPSTGEGHGGTTPVLLRPRTNAVMSSGILAAPGAETGELLIGYPFTSVSTSSTEIVKIQLRVYLGAVMKRPENVILLRNIFFEGLREGSGNKMFDPSKHNVGDGDGMSTDGHDLTVVWFPKKYMLGHSKIDYADFTLENIVKVSDTGERAAYFHTHMQLRRLGMVTETGLDKELIEAGVPTVVYQGACQHKGTEWKDAQTNNGHLGILDDPALADRLFGTFAYSDKGGTL